MPGKVISIRNAAWRIAGEYQYTVPGFFSRRAPCGHSAAGARQQAPSEMKLVNLYIDPADATAAHERLRAAGVMTRLSMVDPHNIKPSKSGAIRIGLSVVFDDQLEDAVKLLENPHHAPKRVITPEEMNEIESPGRGRLFRPATALIPILAACLLGLAVYLAITLIG